MRVIRGLQPVCVTMLGLLVKSPLIAALVRDEWLTTRSGEEESNTVVRFLADGEDLPAAGRSRWGLGSWPPLRRHTSGSGTRRRSSATVCGYTGGPRDRRLQPGQRVTVDLVRPPEVVDHLRDRTARPQVPLVVRELQPPHHRATRFVRHVSRRYTPTPDHRPQVISSDTRQTCVPTQYWPSQPLAPS